MNNRFMYRAYNPIRGELFYFNIWGAGNVPWPKEELGQVTVMPMLPIVDQTGKPIYQGDCVADGPEHGNYIYEAVWEECCWALQPIGFVLATGENVALEINREKYRTMLSGKIDEISRFDRRFILLGNPIDDARLR